MRASLDVCEIAALVPMPELLGALGFAVNQHTRRARCLLHGGSNPTAFSWRDDGRWHCHSCGRGGDRIGLVRAARSCGFGEAVSFLARLAGVDFRAGRRIPLSRAQRAQIARARSAREHAAWRVADEVGRLRRYYAGGLHRLERLWARIGQELLRATEQEQAWESLSRLSAAGTFFLAGWRFISDSAPDVVAGFAMASPGERRRLLLDGDGGAKTEAVG